MMDKHVAHMPTSTTAKAGQSTDGSKIGRKLLTPPGDEAKN
jgi:hypothetical protein